MVLDIDTNPSADLGLASAGIVLAGRRVPLLDKARVYACGITPYDVTHLGHAATFVWVDVLGRVLHLLGVQPQVCRNVTDVDDVLDAAAARARADVGGFAAIQQFEFDRDMTALQVRPPLFEPRAHRYVGHVVRLVAALLDVEAAYQRAGSVYFRGTQVADRAGLSAAQAQCLATEYGGRPDDPAKDDPLDVAVWQAGEPGHPAWDSPWGPGRPGWHAECAAMALSVFGVGVDVHAGGADLRFPHHAYHAAIAEAVTGVRPYARAWLHAGTVTVAGVKMAKSAGNLVLLRDLLAEHTAAALRLLVLDRAWAADWDYTPTALDAASERLDQLYRAAGRTGAEHQTATVELRRLLATDLNVSAALDVAIEAGGVPARLLVDTLGLA
jgi:cysteinyl-tRNA synthetase